MSESNWSKRDEGLLAVLRAGLEESDPVPSDVAEFAKAAFTWRDIDAALAELDFDSAEEDLPSGVRSATTARMISFHAGQWVLDIEFDEFTGRLIGAMSPETTYTIDIHSTGTFFSTESDDLGRFQADGILRGPLSMVVRLPDGGVIKTPWVVL